MIVDRYQSAAHHRLQLWLRQIFAREEILYRLTLIGLEGKDTMASVAVFAQGLRVEGTGRGGKARDEVLKGTALLSYVGKRARKGKAQDAIPKALRLLPA
jgi:hypothetical protein